MPPARWAAENTQPSVPKKHEQVAPESHSGGSSNNSTSQAMPKNLMHPWFALPLAAEQGSEYGCSDSARSRTQPAGGLFRTPPLGTYTMKSRCPRRGGLLRIHSQVSPNLHEQVVTESHSGGSSNNSTSQAMPKNLMHPWFALPLAAEQGSEYGCSDSARSKTQPAGGLFGTPPLGT